MAGKLLFFTLELKSRNSTKYTTTHTSSAKKVLYTLSHSLQPTNKIEVKRQMETYKEKIIMPSKITVEETHDGDRILKVHAQAEGGEEVYQTASAAVAWRLLKMYQKLTPSTPKEILSMPAKKASKILSAAVSAADKNLKVLLDSNGCVANFTSLKHKQVNREDAAMNIETAIFKVFGKEVQRDDLTDSKFSYSLPIKNEYVNSHCGVDLGSNVALGRSAIAIFARFETTTPFGKYPPCLNWSRIWGDVTAWFGIKVKRMNNIASVLGEKAKPFTMRAIHTAGSGISYEEIERSLADLKEGLIAVTPILEMSAKTALSTEEMQDILSVYQKKVGLPLYIKKQIIEAIPEETVFGFSNAVSYIRTHGEIKSHTEDPFTSNMGFKLESIAGEIISLAPTIKELKEKVGLITKDVLLNPPEAIYK